MGTDAQNAWVLEVEMMMATEDDGDPIEMRLKLTEGLDVVVETDYPGRDISGISFYSPWRFRGTWQDLVEVATRWVEIQDGEGESWEEVCIVHADTDEVLPLCQDGHGGVFAGETMTGTPFSAHVLLLEVMLPIELADSKSGFAIGELRREAEALAQEFKVKMEHRFRQIGARVSW